MGAHRVEDVHAQLARDVHARHGEEGLGGGDVHGGGLKGEGAEVRPAKAGEGEGGRRRRRAKAKASEGEGEQRREGYGYGYSAGQLLFNAPAPSVEREWLRPSGDVPGEYVGSGQSVGREPRTQGGASADSVARRCEGSAGPRMRGNTRNRQKLGPGLPISMTAWRVFMAGGPKRAGFCAAPLALLRALCRSAATPRFPNPGQGLRPRLTIGAGRARCAMRCAGARQA